MTPVPTIHEVDFCSQIASAVNLISLQNPKIAPIREARVEGYGKGTQSRKRKDLRFYDPNNRIILCGEVKLPGTLQGRSPFDAGLYRDALAKAEDAGVDYFFTWNVNEFVLWDRSLWNRPLLERRIAYRKLDRFLQNPEDVAREENLRYIKTKFLPELLQEVADIIGGRRKIWGLPPDDVFIQILNSHLNWCGEILRSFILDNAEKNKSFNARIEKWMADQEWVFNRKQTEDWAKSVNNMARTLVYIWSNRLLFYKALQARFSDLPRLALRTSVKNPSDAIRDLGRYFEKAVERSGDYEPLLMPDVRDWASELVFQPANALDAWRGFLHGIEPIDFGTVSSDVVGRIFQKLIDPEERHRYGQHFTGDDVVDVINGFCIRSSDDTILDPACGSGSFLVRAYYRKRALDPSRSHLDLISELFGCDIAPYPAHLATLNLAAREINETANYPRIARRDFFSVDAKSPFCRIPDLPGTLIDVSLPRLDAVVGNPPYVRQEKIDKTNKIKYGELVSQAWPDLELTGRSDLHCYFWPAAARFLKTDGYFGFLTSSSWLDVEYGFALQGWILRHFLILAVMESVAEPWFEDARVKTCITILQRCDSEKERMENLVRFIRFKKPLSELIKAGTGAEENKRQSAIDSLQKRILAAKEDVPDPNFRVIVKRQSDLWKEGVAAGAILDRTGDISLREDEDEEAESEITTVPEKFLKKSENASFPSIYRAGKWGRYLRAPDLYFEIMERFKNKFIALGEIADIRRGITSGCDAFFMPRDVTSEYLEKYPKDKEFRKQAAGAPRKGVELGKLKIIQSGDGSIHPIESEFIAPEVHSLMKVDRPVVRAMDLDRVVLLVGESLPAIKNRAPWTYRYIQYGSQATFASSKSKPVPVPKRATCAVRERWYDLTGLIKPGFAFWSKAQQYRHIVPLNEGGIICNCNLYDLSSTFLSREEKIALVAILNSTLVGFFKTFYGRFAGTEGNLKTEVVDVNLLEIPDPRKISGKIARKLSRALDLMNHRDVGRLVEEQLMDCHDLDRAREIAAGPICLADELRQDDRRSLDDAVFELLGIVDAEERRIIIDRLYQETAKHFRDIRVVEIEKMEQRSVSPERKIGLEDLVQDIWDAAEIEDAKTIVEWISEWPESDIFIEIPDERPAVFPDNPLFELKTIKFGPHKGILREYASREQAELVFALAQLGITGKIRIPADRASCRKLSENIRKRMDTAASHFNPLIESRIGDEKMRQQLFDALMQKFLFG